MPRIVNCVRWRSAASAAAAVLLLVPTPAFAGAYWSSFKRYWTNYIGQTNGVVLTVVVLAAIALFIITRGKGGK